MSNMYSEKLPNTNLRALMDVQDINSITSIANGLLGEMKDGKSLSETTLRARRIQYFYDKVLLDTIKLGSENNVFLKYCQVKNVPAGHEKLLLRRWGGLTEHIVPLKEGVPPKSDRMKSESFEGTFAQFGRFMEFTDRVEFNLIDPVIAHYTSEYGDLAVRTAERLAREEMIRMSSKIYAGNKTFDELVIGDVVSISDYRLLALKLARILVKPISGKYVIICSPEHIYDLVEDPLVEKYMKYTNTAEPLKTGQPVELFNLKFETTMLDDFGYTYAGDMDEALYHPGEYTIADESGTHFGLRCYTQIESDPGTFYYINVEDTTATSAETSGEYRKFFSGDQADNNDNYLRDGSFIPNRVKWIVDFSEYITADSTVTKVTEDGEKTVVDLANADLLAELKNATWYELPVHKSFMFGQEYMVKTGIDGRDGAQMFVKPKGSAGVLDPIDQRQSIGFKIDTLGFNVIREEAIHTFYFVPTKAAATQQFAIEKANDWANYFE